MFGSNSPLNISQGLSITDFFPSSTKINTNPRLSMYTPLFNPYDKNILLSYLNNNKIMRKEKSNEFRFPNTKRGKSVVNNLNISSNNPSTYETSFSNSIFDIKNQQMKNLNISNITSQKLLVHLRPKSDVNKIKVDIILGYSYFLSNQNQIIKKIEKFIFKKQKRIEEKIQKFKKKESTFNKKLTKTKDNKIITNILNSQIKNETKIFHKFENLISIYALIIYYLFKIHKKREAKMIYLLIIKHNINHMKYLEGIINFMSVLADKNGKNKINFYRYANLILLKIYSFFIKYGFLFNLSFYGNLFMKMYLNLSHKYYLYSLANNKIKYSNPENLKKIKIWFSLLNYYSAHFSIAHYAPMKLPIYLYNTTLNIYNTIEEQNLEDKYFILCTKYNKSILLYLNGESEEAINTLKDIKINLFAYIDDNIFANKGNNKSNNKNKSFMIQTLTEQIQKKTKNNQKINKKSVASSFKQIFEHVISGKNKQVNINMKLEPFFIANNPINFDNFFEKYSNIYGISSKLKQQENISNNSSKNTQKSKTLIYSSYLRQLTMQSKNNEKNYSKKIPNIFKNPILIRTELLIAEIELDKKHYRIAYTFTNHALTIITLFRTLQNSSLLNQFKIEQKYIKEFLNIIDNANIITESENEEEEEEKENMNDLITIKEKEYKNEIEYKERINLNKKVLKELEKFFLFYINLSIYQIKVLNETQPKTKIRNYLPILFQNQFKDSLSLRQNIELENLDVMCLSRYLILKDPNKPIYPKNLNISLEYLEKPELFKSKYINKEIKKKLDEESNKKAKIIYKEIIKKTKGNFHLHNRLRNNYYLVTKIIINSKKEEIKEIIDNPEILINSIEKYKKNNNINNDFDKRSFIRQKSQVINNNIFSDHLLGVKTDGNTSSKNIVEEKFHKSFKKDVRKFINFEGNKRRTTRNSFDEPNIFSRNPIKKEIKIKIDSFTSSYKLSVINSGSNSD